MLDIVNTTELNTDNATNTTAVTSYYGTSGRHCGQHQIRSLRP